MMTRTSSLEQQLQATNGLSSAVCAHVIDEPGYGMRTFVAPATRNLKPEFRW